MPEGPLPIDGVTPLPSVPTPVQKPPAPSAPAAGVQEVRKWKMLLILAGGSVYLLYALWCLGLMSILPSSSTGLQSLVPVGLLSALFGAAAFALIGVGGFLRIGSNVTATDKKRRNALIILGIIVVPGILLSGAMAYAVSREPALTLAITSPAAGEELIAPVTMTFDAAPAIDLLKQRGFFPLRYRWDIDGDRKIDQETVQPTISANFEREGLFTVSVVMVDAGQSTRTASRRFVIQKSVFSVNPNPPVIEQPAVFSIAHLVTADNPITKVHWFFDGDDKEDDVTEEPETTYTFYALGKVRVQAVVETQNQLQTRYERTIEVVNPTPLPFPVTMEHEPRYLISPAPFAVLFRIETAEPVSNIQWSFGDGGKGEGQRVAHTFERNGNFPVTAKVRSQSGVLAELTTVVQVVDTLQLSDLSFEGTPAVEAGGRITGEVPLTLNLRPRTNTPFVQFHWEVPEATDVGSTEETLQAIYRKEGTYTVTLVAQDLEDHVLRLPIKVEVKPASNSLSIQMNPETGIAPLSVEFDGAETFIPGETITGFEWNFGDRTPAQFGGARAKHAYTQPGSYVVTMIVRTTSGKEFRADKTLVVRAPLLNACILPSRTAGQAPLGVEFSSDCSTGAVAYLWDFGDNAQSDQKSPIHVFQTPGTYRVSLTVKGEGEREAVTFVTITVRS